MEGFLNFFNILLKAVFVLFIAYLVIQVLSFLLWFLYFRVIKQMELPENLSKYKPTSIFKKLFYEFPKQFWLDRFNSIPRRVQGIWCSPYLWRTGEW